MASILEFRLTGGVTNFDPTLSLGGDTSNNNPSRVPNNNLFWDSTADESASGTGDYICLDIINTGDVIATDVLLFSDEGGEYSAIHLAQGIVNSPFTRNRKTHPSGISFSEYLIASSLSLPDINIGESVRIWVERLIPRSALRDDNDVYNISSTWDAGTVTFVTSWLVIEGNSSMSSVNLIDHTPYEFVNNSNINIDKREIEGERILDVPVFPPQNIVIDDNLVNVYDDPSRKKGYQLSFVHRESIYALTHLDTDQRMVFLNYAEGKRDLVYRFGGVEYPQDRIGATFAITADGLLMWGGQDSKKVDRRELWGYKCDEVTWYPLHPHRDTNSNSFPSMRYDSSLVEHEGDIYIYGGLLYSNYTHTDLTLNDLWWKSKDSNEWQQLDDSAFLPHEVGTIVYVSASVVKILTNGEDGPMLWTVPKDGSDLISEVTSVTAPANIKYTYTPSSGEVHVSAKNAVYKWNNSTESLEQVLSDCGGIGYDPVGVELYIQEGVDKVRRGADSIYQNPVQIYHPRIIALSTRTEVADCFLSAVPIADYMATCDVGDHKKYLGLGMIMSEKTRDELFVEDHWIWDGETLNTIKVPKVGVTPQERLEASCCWDKKRNRIWLFGGYSGSVYYNDLWYLDLTRLTWTRVRDQIRNTVDVNGKAFHPQARAKAGMVVVEDSIWILAGYSDQRSFADMWEYFINTDEAEEVLLNDWVPFGTDYEVFNWRDRMWLFNGENRTLYRYFYDFHLWQPTFLYASRAEKDEGNKLKVFDDFRSGRSLLYEYKTNLHIRTNATVWLPENLDPEDFGEATDTKIKLAYIEKRKKQHTEDLPDIGLLEKDLYDRPVDPRASVFMLAPIRLTVKGNKLIISYNEVNTITGDRDGRITSVLIDMDSKEVMPLPGEIHKGIFWVNPAKSMSEKGDLYYYNISSFELAQWNQIPYFDYSVDPYKYEFGMTHSSVLMHYFDPDTVGGVTERLCYFDRDNMYVIYDDDIQYTPLLPDNKTMKDGLWGEYWAQTDYIFLGVPLEPVYRKESVDWWLAEGYLKDGPPVLPDYPGTTIKMRRDGVEYGEGTYDEIRVHNANYHPANWRASHPNSSRYEDYDDPWDVPMSPIGHDWTEQNKARTEQAEHNFREVPRFLWRRVPKGAMNFICNAQLHWKDEDETKNRIYSVNGKTGVIHRTNVSSRTSLAYPTRMWRESAYANAATSVYSFGGSIIGADFQGQDGGKPKWYQDLMKAVSMGMYRKSYRKGIDKAFILDSHDGFMKYDLSNVNLQLRMLSGREEGDFRPKDYDGLRDYLVSVARDLGIEYTGDLSDDWVEEISETMYDSTMGVAGDMATRYFKNEGGDRPFGPRSAMMSVSRGSELYIMGGCFKYYTVRIVKKSVYIRINYRTQFPYEFTFDDERGRYSYRKSWKYGDCYRFDTQLNEWVKLANLPKPIFGATAILQPDNTTIWLIGGYEGSVSKINHKIYKYNIEQDKWAEVTPLPSGYRGRGKPNCAWIDDHRLMIMFGFNAELDNRNGVVKRLPWGDCWLMDLTKNIMYKVFENTSKTSIAVENLSPNTDPMIDMMDFLDPIFSSTYAKYGIGTTAEKINNFAAAYQDAPDDALIYLPSYIPCRVPRDEGKRFYWNKVDSFDGSIKGIIRVDIPDYISDYFSPGSIVGIFRGWQKDVWIMVNHQDKEKAALSRGFEVYRLAYVNDFRYMMDQLRIDKPCGHQPAHLVQYLGHGKVLVVWNHFNIYELDLRLAAYNPNGKYWKMLPPEPELVYMDLAGDIESFAGSFKKQLVENGVARFYKSDGTIIRYDRKSLQWKLDRETQWSKDTFPVVNRDGNELNYYRRGDTDGRIFNLDTMQTDKFYYDAELLYPDMKFPTIEMDLGNANAMINHHYRGYADVFGGMTKKRVKVDMPKIKEFLANNRSVIKRGRIYTWNENNHLMRAWTRKHADISLQFTFKDYFAIDRVDISVDYDTMEQADRFVIEVNTEDGWIELPTYASQEATGWDWTPSNRVYRKQMMTGHGYTYVEGTRPGYYIRANMVGHYVKGVKVKFFPKAEEWNYIARINHIYIVSEENTLSFVSGQDNLNVMYIEPFDGEDSDIYTVQMKNNHPRFPCSNVSVFIKDNHRILLSRDNVNWIMATKDDKLHLVDRLDPSATMTFYIKAKNSLDKSGLDLMLDGDFPLEQ